nr:hypothetical protein [Tanacetum cinerariifolium]
MVAYLSKSDASEGFNQIIDFLNGSSIKYALTKKIVVTEATIREALRLDDAEGVDCLPNEEIFTELARMGYEKPSTKLTFYKAFFSSQWKFFIHTILQCISDKQTSWNEFSSSIASAIICLSSGDLSTHTTKYTSPALTQKVFTNMRRVEKGFSEVETPLFTGMMVEQPVDAEGDADESVAEVNAGDAAHGDDSAAHGEVPTVPEEPSFHILHHLLHHLNHLKISLQHPKRVKHLEYDKVAQALEITKLKKRVKKLEKRNKEDMEVADAVKDVAKEDKTEPAEVHEVVEVVTNAKLIYEVTATSDPITAASTTIPAAAQVPDVTITSAPARVAAAPSRRRKGVVIRDPESESTSSTIIPTETKSKDKGKGIMVEEPKPLKKKQQIELDEQYDREMHAELNKDIDWDEVINHVKIKAKEDPAMKKYQAMKRTPQTESQARKNMILYLKNVISFKMDYFKGMSYDDIHPIFEAKFNSNVAFLLKTKEWIEEEENRALQKLNETPAERAAKRRKLDEDVEELKRHLQIAPNEDDDVYTEATPLAQKVPIVDYQVIEMNNKPYYKIIRTDDTHQLYVSFLSLLRNFDREDLEALWNLVKERFSTSKPKNFFDDFLLVTPSNVRETRYTCSDLEESENYTWSSKGQRMETTRIMWCADHNVYIYSTNFVSREEVPTHKIYSRPDAECCKA